MTPFASALRQLESFGLHPEAVVSEPFRVGFDIGETTFTTDPSVLLSNEQATDWACIVGTLLSGVKA
jgi:hypothetical protein